MGHLVGRTLKPVYRPRQAIVVDVEVKDASDTPIANRQHQHTALADVSYEFHRIRDLDIHDVRRRWQREFDAVDAFQRFAELARASMVLF